jgi:adenylate cyclase
MQPDADITFRGFTLNCDAGTLVGPDGPVVLRPKTLALLELLVRNPSRVMSKAELLDAVWSEVTVTEDTLTQTVHELRKALGDIGASLIRTVPRRGYVFDAVPTEVARDSLTLMVLPFANLSSDPEQQFFADGLTTDIEAALDLIAELDVIPARDGAKTARHVLSGAVRASGREMRVTSRLTDTSTGRVVWNGRFDGDRTRIFAFQDDIVRNIAIALQIELTRGDFARLWDGQTKSLAAWERMVGARTSFLRWSEADMRNARRLAEEALAIDPDYSAARLILGFTWWYDARFFGSVDRDLALDETEAAANEIIRRNPEGATGWILLSLAMWMRDRHDEALDHARRACALAPGDIWARGHIGVICTFSGQEDIGLASFEAAIRLAPLKFDWLLFHQAHAQLWAGNLDVALKTAQTYRTQAPSDQWGLFLVGLIHAFAGRFDKARLVIGEIAASPSPIRIADVRRSQRHRDPTRLERVVAAMRAAGMPD